MSFLLGFSIAVLTYLALLIFVVGVVLRIVKYFRTPSKFLLPIFPAPATRTGVVLRVLREVFLFESLFRASKWTWLFGWLFHVALFVVLLRHLFFIVDPVWDWVIWLFPYGDLAAAMMLFGLLGLSARRFLVDRIRYISTPSDHLMLLLLVVICVSGLLLANVTFVDLSAVRNYALGLRVLQINELPTSLVLNIHLSSVILLVVIFPFSKLMHFIAPVFSPPHTQTNTPSSTSRGS